MKRNGTLGGTLLVVLAVSASFVLAACTGSREAGSVTKEKEVNIGYGTMAPSQSTASVASADRDDFEDRSVQRVEELLEGRFAGVQVIRDRNGYSIRIRGVSSIYGSNEPLVVLDGMPLQTSDGMGLAHINPNDIASIDVLKDASATAIYGSRGANGVILITTRRASDE